MPSMKILATFRPKAITRWIEYFTHLPIPSLIKQIQDTTLWRYLTLQVQRQAASSEWPFCPTDITTPRMQSSARCEALQVPRFVTSQRSFDPSGNRSCLSYTSHAFFPHGGNHTNHHTTRNLNRASRNLPLPSSAAVKLVRSSGVHVLTAQEADRQGQGHPDENHAAFALKDGRVLLTCDRGYRAVLRDCRPSWLGFERNLRARDRGPRAHCRELKQNYKAPLSRLAPRAIPARNFRPSVFLMESLSRSFRAARRPASLIRNAAPS